MPAWLTILVLAATVVFGAVLMGWWISRNPIRRRGFAVASALVMSFAIFNPNQDKIVEVREEGEHAKRQKAGDPPDTDE